MKTGCPIKCTIVTTEASLPRFPSPDLRLPFHSWSQSEWAFEAYLSSKGAKVSNIPATSRMLTITKQRYDSRVRELLNSNFLALNPTPHVQQLQLKNDVMGLPLWNWDVCSGGFYYLGPTDFSYVLDYKQMDRFEFKTVYLPFLLV